MSVRELTYMITIKDGEILTKQVMSRILGMSAREMTRCRQFEDGVLVCHSDGSFLPARMKDVLRPGDVLKVRIYEDIDNASEIIPRDIPIDIVYEDEDIILLNKPGDMVVHPSYAHFEDSLSNALAGYFEKTGQNHVIRAIGRLDRETSGLILFAKNRHSAAVLSDQKKNMSGRKEYLAICCGTFKETQGTVNAPIGQIPGERMIRRVMEDGKEAVTHYRVEEQYPAFALVRLNLDTGRTHQIRVHMKYIGHPLLGDNLYGEADASAGEIQLLHTIKRAALHAAHLEFIHPITGEKLSFDSPLPPDMKSVITAAGSGS